MLPEIVIFVLYISPIEAKTRKKTTIANIQYINPGVFYLLEAKDQNVAY